MTLVGAGAGAGETDGARVTSLVGAGEAAVTDGAAGAVAEELEPTVPAIASDLVLEALDPPLDAVREGIAGSVLRLCGIPVRTAATRRFCGEADRWRVPLAAVRRPSANEQAKTARTHPSTAAHDTISVRLAL